MTFEQLLKLMVLVAFLTAIPAALLVDLVLAVVGKRLGVSVDHDVDVQTDGDAEADADAGGDE